MPSSIVVVQGMRSELRGCVKVEVAVLISNSPYGLCGRKATLNSKEKTKNKKTKKDRRRVELLLDFLCCIYSHTMWR